MAANEGVIKAVVNFYQDDSDAVFLGLSYDLRPNSNFDWLIGWKCWPLASKKVCGGE